MGIRMGHTMSSVQVPHFTFPFALNGNSFGVVEQDTIEEIQQCVEILLLTPSGSRLVLPDYGTPETLFAQMPINVPAILNKLNKWEPRAAVTLDQTLGTIQTTASIQVNVSTGGN
jgi:phage baseplate assembly protein W